MTIFLKFELLPDIERFSKWLRLIRSTAWCQRFLKIIQKKDVERLPYLTVQELSDAEKIWIQKSQHECYPEELHCLKEQKNVKNRSKLKSLCPELKNDLLVLGSRIKLAKCVSETTKNPTILNSKHKVTKLIIQHVHEKFGHRGVELVLNEIRQKYWIVDGRAAIKSVISKCQKCRNDRTKPVVPIMGQLPEERLSREVRPFVNVGMDYFGPIFVKIGRRQEKRWGVIFTCLSVRAIHLEIAHTLTCDSAILAIKRFIARRGKPQKIFCDNGTNFKAADKEIRKTIEELRSSNMEDAMVIKGIDFRFIPPGAPHMGGSWERLIGAVKRVIGKILHDQSLREETLITLFAEAENIVNSRPITKVSSDPSDLEALTPNHFLIGSSNGDGLPIQVNPDSKCLRSEWKKCQMFIDSFWQRWVKEYLPTLNKRSKWTKDQENLKLNDVVVLVENNAPRHTWKMGVISAVYPGPDSRIRVVDVKTATTTYRRPVTKICRLEVED